MNTLTKIPLFEKLADSKNILLAGAGGGFDIYSGLPLYFALKAEGKNVILANFSFTRLSDSNAQQEFPFCYLVNSSSREFSGRGYFPEKILCEWFLTQDQRVELYAFERTGVQPLKEAYNHLIDRHDIDTVVLVDGGTDSLMFGDEDGLVTPEEDICSMAAVYQCKVKNTYLVSIGFGVDHFHGVSHYRFLENVAELIRDGGFLGTFSVTKEIKEGALMLSAVNYANIRMKGKESIVANSIASAIDGQYGNHQFSERTKNSELWINPLMSMYWCFDLASVMKKNKYYPRIKSTLTMSQINGEIARFKGNLKEQREKRNLPL